MTTYNANPGGGQANLWPDWAIGRACTIRTDEADTRYATNQQSVDVTFSGSETNDLFRQLLWVLADIHHAYPGSMPRTKRQKADTAPMNSAAAWIFIFLKRKIPMRALLGLSTLGLYLATAALAQAPAPHQPEVTPPASQTAPWLQTLPGRRGLEPRPKPGNKGILTDINSAALKELIGLKNIGRSRGDDIIKGRPYNDKDDLVRRKILPPDVYDEIKDAIVARHQSVR
jgi:hypothetical protein